MLKRAIILLEGASNSLLYIKAARSLDIYPITISADPELFDYLAALGIEAVRVDNNDFDSLIRECIRLRSTYEIAGITSAQESAYAMVGQLCRYFDLPGPNAMAVERCCDKFVQRQLLAEAGLRVPAYRLAVNATEVERSATEIGLPVILKPAIGIGSSGVRLCRTLDEMAEHMIYLLSGKHKWRSSPRILVEEFAQGPQYNLEIMGDQVIAIGAANYGPPNFFCRGHIYPAPLSEEECKRIADLSLSCLRALGLGWGPTNIELRWTNHGPTVIEVNPRLAGSPVPNMVQLAYGVDLITNHIRLVVGEELDLRERQSHAAASRYLLPECDGTLDRIDGGRRAAALSGVAEVKFYVEPKAPIIMNSDSGDRIAHVVATSPSRARTEAILQDAVDLIDWSITPFPTLSGAD
ncbi:acetyl-CoA carboxylase biotin carboxylase subunit family protein [Mesorhizobium sp. M0138]|uniref:ATP-grasp domain-containing protein n=1 Tax=Mesorhizobium sp. M0138 TaxID=2956891 RepID=UPI00333D1348